MTTTTKSNRLVGKDELKRLKETLDSGRDVIVAQSDYEILIKNTEQLERYKSMISEIYKNHAWRCDCYSCLQIKSIILERIKS